MFKFVVLPLVVVALLVAAWLTAAWKWSYSTGERAGWVQKLSNKGWVCKTWEGELALVSLPGSTAEKFNFTVHDEAVAQHGLMKATDREVLDRLERPEAWPRVVLLAAIEEAGTRRLNDATPWCIRLLSHADTEIVLRSMGTLGRIGNPSALKPLGRLALSPSPEIPHVAVRVIADIGGPEARRVLELIRDQAGHSLVGKEASEAISDMEHGGE